MSTAVGKAAEDTAAQYLQDHGYRVLDQNWKTRYCEIDVIASKQKVVWFVEVKYRSTGNQGYGYEYVTTKKLEQMRFAAEMWVQSNDWRGEYRLAVISVDGEEITLIDEL